MIKTIEVINYVGDSLVLDLANPYKTGFAISNIDGIASLKSTINTTKVATNDGTVYNSARVENRNIVFTFLFLDDGERTAEDIRLDLYKYFPVKKELTLHFVTENRDVQIHGYVESSESTVFAEQVSAQVSIICPNPYFEDVNAEIVDFSGVEPLFEFPFGDEDTKNNLIMSEVYNTPIRTVYYLGDVENGVTIDIHATGPVEDLVIYNRNTGEVMSISDELKTLDDITITTYRNSKSATLMRDGIQTNILNRMAKDADWFELQKGDNVFAYLAGSGADNLQFRITTRILYEGI